MAAGAADEWEGGKEGDEEGYIEEEKEEMSGLWGFGGFEKMKEDIFDKGIASWLFTILKIALVVVGLYIIIGSIAYFLIGTAAAQPPPAPSAKEEAGVPWGYIAIGATIILLVALWMPRKQPASGEGGEQEAAWWATKKGREFIITLLLLFLIMAGLMYVGIKALVAGGFLFVAWMIYRYYFAGDEEDKVVTTQTLARDIADEFEYLGEKLDGIKGVYGVFLPGLDLHLVGFSHPTSLTFALIVRKGVVQVRSGPYCCTLHEAVDMVKGDKELWMSQVEGAKEKKLPIVQIGTEGREV